MQCNYEAQPGLVGYVHVVHHEVHVGLLSGCNYEVQLGFGQSREVLPEVHVVLDLLIGNNRQSMGMLQD